MKAKRMLFIAIIFISIVTLGTYPLIKQEESNISYLEKRELSHIKPLSKENWLSKEFQTSVDDSLIDNFYQRNGWLKHYNKLNMNISTLGNQLMSIVFQKQLGEKIILEDINEKISYINEISYLARSPYVYDEEVMKEIDINIKKIELMARNNRDIDFYIYLPLMANENSMFDINGVNKRYLGLFNNSMLPAGKLEVENTYDLKKTYFSTDHHWTHVGAYQGYMDIVELIFNGTEKSRTPISEETFDEVHFYGSHSRSIAHSVELEGDPISKYIFELPEYELYVDGVLTDGYGHYDEYVKGDIDSDKDFDHYNWMYQMRKAEIIFDTKREEFENILIISDSMSNAIRDVLASHFNKAVFINLDSYNRTYGEFDIERYINEYEVDKVLVMVVLENYFPDGELKHLRVE